MIPIRTDLKLKRTPYANYAFILVNFLIFWASYSPHTVQYGLKTMVDPLKDWTQTFILNSAHPQIWQFVTYAFLHSSYQHIIGNMFFLYLFGNNVNDRLGNTGYVSFYIAGSIFAGIGYSMLHDTPVLGASGAVAAVTGAYIVLFPRSVITVVYWFVIIGTIDVPALWFVILKMVLIDNVIQSRYMAGPIAYSAHLSGYAFGITTILLLLWTGLLKKSKFDMAGILKQWYRRWIFRHIVKQSEIDSQTGFNIEKVKADANGSPVSKEVEDIYKLRAEISSLLLNKNLQSAADKYGQLINMDESQALPLRQQLDMANYLMAGTHYEEASVAYEKFITAYSDYEYIEQIHLMLGLLYARYLEQKEPAAKYLNLAKEKLADPEQQKMCEIELKKLNLDQ